MGLTIKLVLVWVFALFLLQYNKLFTILLNSVLSLLYYEYQVIFKQICSSQTGTKEEMFISRLSSSKFPYILNQVLILLSTLSCSNTEKVLCISFILSSAVALSLRLNQYSRFCSEITEAKRKKKKITKTKEGDL